MTFLNVREGDILRMKKKHPCGCLEWEVTRVGADLRLRCRGCGHPMIMSRSKAAKAVREIVKAPEGAERGPAGALRTEAE